MAKNEEKVMQFVEKTLEKTPDISTSDLYAQAKKIDSGVEQLSLRQFNARFPLQIKRRKSMSRPGRKRVRRRRTSRTVSSEGRDGVRDAFLKFASDLSAAEERKDLVKVIARVDQYVDEALEAAKK